MIMYTYAVGDRVVVENANTAFVGEVIRITPKGFVVVGIKGQKQTHTFNPEGRERTSDTWTRRMIRPLTEEDVRLAQLAKGRRTAKKYFERYWQQLSNEQSDRIIEVLKELEGKVE